MELSSPVDISSINRAFVGPTIISPARISRDENGFEKNIAAREIFSLLSSLENRFYKSNQFSWDFFRKYL